MMKEKKGLPRGRQRLDVTVFERGLAESRQKAWALVLAGSVRVDGVVVTKPSTIVSVESVVELVALDHPYVSRGGLKLQHAIDRLSVDFRGKVVLDVGASTGGFTHCLLMHGASRVIALDVGYGQLHWKLRNDQRVTVMERTNIRHVRPGQLPVTPQGAVIDVSFISLRLVLPVVLSLVELESPVVVLVKPQFELDRGMVGRKGVVHDTEKQALAVERVRSCACDLGARILGSVPAPIKGPKGNQEHLLAMLSMPAGAP